MKKLIAMLACLTLVITMFAGLTVSAADYGTPTFKLVPQTEADGSLSVVDGCYVVDLVYEGFENFAALSGSSRKPSATGIMGAEVYWSSDNAAAYVYDGADAGVGKGGISTEVAVISATDVATIVTGTSGVICSAYYVIEDEEAVANLKIDSVVVNVRKYVDGAAVTADAVDLATADVNLVGCTLGKTTPPATESAYNVTYAGDKVVWGDKPATTVSSTDASKTVTFTVKPAFGYVITAVTGVATAIPEGGEMTATIDADNTEIVVTVAEKDEKAITYDKYYVDGNTVYVFGKVPAATKAYGINIADVDYAGANAVDGAFGIALTGLEAGSYNAYAYGDEDGNTVAIAID